MYDKVYGALGLARRAGKCITGDFAVERAVKAKRVALVVVDAAASDATRERYTTICNTHGIARVELPAPGQAVGKPGNRIIAIADAGFAAMVKKTLETVTDTSIDTRPEG